MRPLFLGDCAAWGPPIHAYLPSAQWRISGQETEDFLRQAAHEGVLGGLHHSELPLYFGSLSATLSHTLFALRGSDYYCIVRGVAYQPYGEKSTVFSDGIVEVDYPIGFFCSEK